MSLRCPICSRVNPPNAVYCYYDGRALDPSSLQGPLGIGTMRFPTPFYFPDGHCCWNFNQLALACDDRWKEARTFLAEGVWVQFFTAMGRLDLAATAKEAARETDLDVGLTHLLDRLPADPEAQRPPKLGVFPAVEDLGTLEPGKDRKFELHIANQGMRVLRGMATTDCEWLTLGDQQGCALKMFQTRSTYSLSVRVLGGKLRAGQKPLEGNVVIDTNGGTITVPVRANVPVRPFPEGQYANDVLAGARSPRELAAKAKANPREAAVLFEQGAVKAWYASNGWTYPIQGTTGTGKGAVQQYFDALGLSKPPPLEINTTSIVAKGEVGQNLTKLVTISTKESRLVYANAQSNQDWIKPGAGKSRGNTATVPLQIEVPPRPGETLRAEVTFLGNGNQRFVVPVTLEVAPQSPRAESRLSETRGGLSLGWIGAGVALLLVIVIGALMCLRGGAAKTEVEDDSPRPVVIAQPEPAWWDGIRDHELAASLAALKENAPEVRAILEKIADRTDVNRYKPYQQLAERLPELLRNPRVREPLGRFIRDCLVHEPSELNAGHLWRALAAQLPPSGAEFRPEEQGSELERAFFALQVFTSAVKNGAISPERVRVLIGELDKAFEFAIDTNSPIDQFDVQAEKLLTLRCYRNILPTAKQSLEHALSIRAVLIDRFPQHLARNFRDQVDVDLVVIALAQGGDTWPALEPIVKTCLESNDLSIGLKIVDLYEAQKDPDLAQKMEAVLEGKFKAAINPGMTLAEKAAAIRKGLIRAANRAKITPADRLAQLQKLTDSALKTMKASEKKETALLQDTVRLTHASTMACTLFHKDADVARFDDLVVRLPAIEQVEQAAEREKPNQPAGKEAIVVGAQPQVIQGQLTLASERDPARNRAFCKVYTLSMRAGEFYTIDMVSTAFNSYLRLEGPKGEQVAADDDGGGYPHARLRVVAPSDGDYRLIATTSHNGVTGAYTLRIQAGFGAVGHPWFGMYRYDPRTGKIVPGVVQAPVPVPKPEGPKKGEEKESRWSPNDLAALASPQSDVRVAAFNKLAGSIPTELPRQHAIAVARYLLATIQEQRELDKITPKLPAFAACRPLLLALADMASNEKNTYVTQQRTEAIVSELLLQRVRFARDEDWRMGCRKLLLNRVLELTGMALGGADQAAQILRDLYREQAIVLGVEDPDLLQLTQPALVLERVIKHVAARAGKQNAAPVDGEYLTQIDRHLQAAQFVAENDLEHMVLLQRLWMRVLNIYLRGQVPARADGLMKIQQDLDLYDQGAHNVLDQLRAGEEKLLRMWALANNLSG